MKFIPIHNEQDLLVRIAGGDEHAFTILYKKYWPILYLHAHRMLGDEKMAEDAVQETFTWFWQNAPMIDLKSYPSSYLYGAVRNHVLNLMRHQKVKAGYANQLSAFLKEGHEAVDEELAYKELVRLIESEIDKMPPRMKEVFNLSRTDLLSHHQIAEMLNISESTVREHIKRALRQLRGSLRDSSYFIFVLVQIIR